MFKSKYSDGTEKCWQAEIELHHKYAVSKDIVYAIKQLYFSVYTCTRYPCLDGLQSVICFIKGNILMVKPSNGYLRTGVGRLWLQGLR